MWQINLWFSWFALTHLLSVLFLCFIIPSCTIVQMVWCILSQEKADMVARRCHCRVHARRNHHFNHRPAKLLLIGMLFVAVVSNKGPHFKLDFQITDNTMIVCSNFVEVHFKAITIMASWEFWLCWRFCVWNILCVYRLCTFSSGLHISRTPKFVCMLLQHWVCGLWLWNT